MVSDCEVVTAPVALLELSEAHRALFPISTQRSASILQAWTLLLVRQRVLSQVTQCRGAAPSACCQNLAGPLQAPLLISMALAI